MSRSPVVGSRESKRCKAFEDVEPENSPGLPVGPANADELSVWLDRLFRCCYSSTRDGQVLRMQRTEVLFEVYEFAYSDFSGVGCAETVKLMLVHKFAEAGLRLPEGWFMASSACECDKTCLQILSTMRDGPLHTVPSMLDKRPRSTAKKIMSMRPGVDSPSVDERTTGRFLSQQAYLQKHGSRIFNEARTIPTCARHPGCQCTILGTVSLNSAQPLRTSYGSPECVTWSQMGAHKREEHASMESYYIWQEQVAAGDYALAFLENVKAFPPSLLRERLIGEAIIVSLITSPTRLGSRLPGSVCSQSHSHTNMCSG